MSSVGNRLMDSRAHSPAPTQNPGTNRVQTGFILVCADPVCVQSFLSIIEGGIQRRQTSF